MEDRGKRKWKEEGKEIESRGRKDRKGITEELKAVNNRSREHAKGVKKQGEGNGWEGEGRERGDRKKEKGSKGRKVRRDHREGEGVKNCCGEHDKGVKDRYVGRNSPPLRVPFLRKLHSYIATL